VFLGDCPLQSPEWEPQRQQRRLRQSLGQLPYGTRGGIHADAANDKPCRGVSNQAVRTGYLNVVSAFLNVRVADIDAIYEQWTRDGAT